MAHIETTEDGPFLVHGLAVRRAEPVVSEHGEPMTWSFGPEPMAEPGDEPLALCRCGRSGNRPFCDGTHATTEWESVDGHHPDGTYRDRARRLEGASGGQTYTLLDDTPLCMHAGHCGTERRTVWQMLADTDDTEVRATVIRMVEKCPSGRLTNVIDEQIVEPSLPAEVNVVPGGPLWVTGGVPISDAAGEPLETRTRVTLCRCGASGNKPLCDGSHDDIGFETDTTAGSNEERVHDRDDQHDEQQGDGHE